MGRAEHRVVDTLALQPTVPENLPGLHPREGVLDTSTDTAVRGVVLLLPCGKRRAWSSPRRDDTLAHAYRDWLNAA